MTAQQQATVVSSVTVTGAVAARRGVAPNGTQAALNSNIIGFADHAAVAGEILRVVEGVTAMAEAGAAIPLGTNLASTALAVDAQGRVIPLGANTVIAARLKQGQFAAGAGDIVEVYPVIN
jgi:hypothetical protein